MSNISSIYVIAARGTPNHKIGLSVDPWQRLAQLQVGCPYKLSLMFTAAADENLIHWTERALHKRLNSRRVLGEWFNIDLHSAIGWVYGAVSTTFSFRERHGRLPRSLSKFDWVDMLLNDRTLHSEPTFDTYIPARQSSDDELLSSILTGIERELAMPAPAHPG